MRQHSQHPPPQPPQLSQLHSRLANGTPSPPHPHPHPPAVPLPLSLPLPPPPAAAAAAAAAAAVAAAGHSAHPPQSRMSNDLRNRTPLPVPSGATAHVQNGHTRSMSAIPPFDMARSPPNPASKNTKHVPCKFFRQGACQAGPACPFLHSTDSSVDSAPCKYFSKGNCKFGAKCALAHILPDGRRVNRPNMMPPMGMSGGHLNLGGRVNPQQYHTQDSALANSLLSQQHVNGHGHRFSYPFPGGQDDIYGHQQPQNPPVPFDGGIPTIEAGFVPDNGSKYGSPPEEQRLPMSPIGNTALDAPLPASFDSQGISYMARHGPVAASLPSKFGLDLSSPPSQRPGPPSDVLRNLHDAAFGLDSRKPANLGTSPPVILDEGSAPRLMHSQRISRPKILSASVPRSTALDGWDDSFTLEEDYLPPNLHDDVLTPQERMRRLSRTEQDHGNLSSARDFGGLGMPSAGTGRVGSPLASSPSRFGAIFAKQRQRKEEEGQGQVGFGHVGSPLRESSLNYHAASPSPNLRPIGSRPTSGDVSPFISSPSRQSSMSIISQQLSSTSLHPSSARHASTGSRLDRSVSSPVSTSRIDEEQSDLVFSMEEEENNKRNSTVWNSSNTAGSAGHNHNTNANKASTKGKDGSTATAAGQLRQKPLAQQQQQVQENTQVAAMQGQQEGNNGGADAKGKTLLKEIESLYSGGRA
ncbi:hypothetical protein ACO22_04126 [Paracoccidioides brasiliensis]|uniref:C3H1-type domain-containing protein n=1 Tax=Paracoccidioides brasiliensis TaxID=121759 RepID=A0A1D2JE76_PARBR|nr:hypothetical protein ACO22_04126 [Paracoccidioides brasiliensis]